MAFLRLLSMLTAGGTLAAYGVLSGGVPAYAWTNPHAGPGRHLGQRAHPRPAPWAIEIPSIGLRAGVLPLGAPDGLALPVPSLARAAADAGWYRFTAVPGTAGNSVIVGHVDTYVGPAVFYRLYQLRPRELVYVNLGGTRQRFAVSSVRELEKARFPVNQVFGATTRRVLWLITCGGAFDYQSGHYLDNILVSATWQPVPDKAVPSKAVPSKATPEKRERKSAAKRALRRTAAKAHRRSMPAATRPARNEFS